MVPECAAGTTLKVPAPDGISLHVPLPSNVLPGDHLYMAKSEDGRWFISKAVRGAPSDPVAKVQEWKSAEALEADLAGPDVVRVRLETTKGPIILRIVPAWAPLGVKRFLELVDDGYYHDIAIYRAMPKGLVQFGIVQSTDPRSSRYAPLEDDPLLCVPFEEGSVSFASAGSGTRKSIVCLFLGDFKSQLGRRPTETPIGKVCTESMGTLRSLYTGYGDIPQCGGSGPDPEVLKERGNEYIRSEFPLCDYITGASRV